MIVVLYEVQNYLKDTSAISRYSPIWGNNYFVPGRADGGFKLWAERGITQIKDVFGPGGDIKTFEDFVIKYNLSRKYIRKSLRASLEPIKVNPCPSRLYPHWRKI